MRKERTKVQKSFFLFIFSTASRIESRFDEKKSGGGGGGGEKANYTLRALHTLILLDAQKFPLTGGGGVPILSRGISREYDFVIIPKQE